MLQQSNFPNYAESNKTLSVPANTGAKYLLESKSFFWSPDYLEVSAWTEHIPFAFWITEVLQPKVVVELGVHLGNSYFAFCQAVDRLNLETACYGIDTWKGDEHAGFYGEEIFNKVAGYNASRYSKFSTLIRSTFDDAKNYFIDGSVDLLHIDGAHTYEAVKEDFDSWLPKLSSRAVVIFHDINVRERNFGVFRLWDELKEQYRHFQFDFGFGLGVLALGEIDREEIDQLFDSENSDPYRLFLSKFFFERGSFFKRNFEISAALIHANQDREVERNDRLELAERYQALVEENKKQKEENNNLLLKSQESLAKISRKLEEENANNQQLQAEILKQNQTLKWYKDTYEDRSILGVLKEKLTSRSKKKIIPFNADNTLPQTISDQIRPVELSMDDKHRYSLNPAHNLVTLPEAGSYKSVGKDAFFVADIDNRKIKKGWYALSIEINETEGFLLNPRLYFDAGSGFTEKYTWNLPPVSNNKIECLIYIPFTITRFRFDPSEHSFAIFNISNFALAKVPIYDLFKQLYKSRKLEQAPFFLKGKSCLKIALILLKKDNKTVQTWLTDSIAKDDPFQYQRWIRIFDTYTQSEIRNFRANQSNFPDRPLISILLPTYNTPLDWLKACIQSVLDQVYDNWELCIADDNSSAGGIREMIEEFAGKDERIKYIFRETNGHIAVSSNSALSLAAGEFVTFLDHDDTLASLALYRVVEALNNDGTTDFFYSDEDKIDGEGNRSLPFFKPGWSPALFYSQNYITHLACIRRSLLMTAGGFTEGTEGSQDYDLFLKVISLNARIKHLPFILYHWRLHEASTSLVSDSKPYAHITGKKAVERFLSKTYPIHYKCVEDGEHTFTYLPRFTFSKENKVSIIIPTKDKIEYLRRCIDSIISKSTWENYEIIILNNNSSEEATFSYFKKLKEQYPRIKVEDALFEFNWSKLNNFGSARATGNFLIFLNNDTSVITPDWIEKLCEYAGLPDVATVGASLLYEDNTIQHAGVIVGMNGWADHVFKGMHRSHFPSPYISNVLPRNVLAVTGACLAIERSKFERLGLFDESFIICGSDVELCIRAHKEQFFNVVNSAVKLYHYESKSRGSDVPENDFMQSAIKYEPYRTEQSDPFYNLNLSLTNTSPTCKTQIDES